EVAERDGIAPVARRATDRFPKALAPKRRVSIPARGIARSRNTSEKRCHIERLGWIEERGHDRVGLDVGGTREETREPCPLSRRSERRKTRATLDRFKSRRAVVACGARTVLDQRSS